MLLHHCRWSSRFLYIFHWKLHRILVEILLFGAGCEKIHGAWY
ncbi:hypothetical protein EVA_19641 [gut metagenome]|uniref:Uncharacterized protein n=1 Tax=gut metagenome TaxID=749906 RepID=J9FRP1_9ZZZZ